ncbi:MAG: hypothetical protein JWO52_4290 [Gammaproteobacteria bacterium]|jgi:hypothetical protein|nr:hypothetical protein [Gammaproteobacteria bacterium]
MRVWPLLLVVAALAFQSVRADPLQYEFLLLPSVEAGGVFDRKAPETEVRDEVIRADLLLSLQKGPFKLFGEYLKSDHEGDLERFQLGWQLSNDTVIWVGRFHQPSSVWNHEHHHGQYLQTSITRPSIDEWEDLGGVLPQHFTGVLVESSKAVADAWRLRTALAAGIAPQLGGKGMEPFDLLHPDSERHKLGFQARVSLHPGDFTETGFGILAAYDDMPGVGLEPGNVSTTALLGLDHVELQLYGLFGTYAATAWKLFGTAYYADAQLFYTGSRIKDSFTVGYLQFERRVVRDLTGYVRWEDSISAGHAYLELFDRYARSRHVAGLRWDFAQRQAISVQFADTHKLHGRYSDIRLQWSAAFF